MSGMPAPGRRSYGRLLIFTRSQGAVMAGSRAGVPRLVPGLVSELITDVDQRLQLTYATLTVDRIMPATPGM
jgi:hypothetical protein